MKTQLSKINLSFFVSSFVVPVLLISIILFPFHLGSTMLDVFIMLAVLLYANKDRQEENAIQPVE
jgi:hypothetical protein